MILNLMIYKSQLSLNCNADSVPNFCVKKSVDILEHEVEVEVPLKAMIQ